MGVFIELLLRFRSDERGVFAVLFGVMAVVLVATAGAVVDFTSIEQARTRAQQALDSAALGLQPTIYTTGVTAETIKPRALELLTERLDDGAIAVTMATPVINKAEGTLKLDASITVNTAFVQLVGISSVTAKVSSEATRKRLNLEIAMVLDNSGSMSTYVDANNNRTKDNGERSRMDNLILAARCATNVLFSGTSNCAANNLNTEDAKPAVSTNVKIGVVPFTEFVNVGPANRTASWMDQTGASSLSNDNFDNDDNEASVYNGAVNRFQLYDQLTNVSWAGCVEARKQPYDTTDEPPLGGDTLFVPQFAPDEPTGYSNNYLDDRPAACTNKDSGAWYEKKTKVNCPDNYNGNDSNKLSRYNSCGGTETFTYIQTGWDGSQTIPAWTTQPASLPDRNGNPNYPKCTAKYSSSGSKGNFALTIETTCNYSFSDRELQERLCKYTGNINTSRPGPNQDCPFNALTPLTNAKATVLAAVKAMAPQGYTNIHQGAIWGYHMLSQGEPLTEAQSYASSTVKVMILMTDGENTVDGYDSGSMNRADGFMAYGYPGPAPYNGRIYSSTYPNPASDAQVTAAMDSRTLETCTQAKKPVATGEPDKIVIYTIGLNAPNQKTINLLTNCATDADHAFFPTDPTTLTDTFKLIADQLANLRLAK